MQPVKCGRRRRCQVTYSLGVAYSMFSYSNVTGCVTVLVFGEHVSDSGDVETFATAEPVEMSNDVAEVCFSFV